MIVDNNTLLLLAGITYAKAGETTSKKIRECAAEVIRNDGDVDGIDEKRLMQLQQQKFPTKEAEDAFKKALLNVSTMLRGTQPMPKEKKKKKTSRKVEKDESTEQY